MIAEWAQKTQKVWSTGFPINFSGLLIFNFSWCWDVEHKVSPATKDYCRYLLLWIFLNQPTLVPCRKSSWIIDWNKINIFGENLIIESTICICFFGLFFFTTLGLHNKLYFWIPGSWNWIFTLLLTLFWFSQLWPCAIWCWPDWLQ